MSDYAGGLTATRSIVAVLFALMAAVIGIGCGGDEELTATEIAEQRESSTLMVVVRHSGPGTYLGDPGDITGGGSAWVYDAEEGLIVTNAHVIAYGSKFQAGFGASELVSAQLVAVNARDDLAMLRVSPLALGELETLPSAEEPAAQGNTVFALGYPGNSTTDQNFLKSPYQATQGIISSIEGQGSVGYDAWNEKGNDRTGQLLSGLYQTDAAINAGNSGGPLVNDRGELVGTNVAAGGVNQGYAISPETLDAELPKLAAGESTAWLGIGVSAVSKSFTESSVLTSDSLSDGEDHYNGDLNGAVELVSIARDTPVDQQTELGGELKWAVNNDRYIIITEVNSQPVTSQQEYINAIEDVQSGEQVGIEWMAVTFEEDVNVGPYEERFSAP